MEKKGNSSVMHLDYGIVRKNVIIYVWWCTTLTGIRGEEEKTQVYK